MKKEFTVRFDIQTEAEFNTKEEYPNLKITPIYSDNKLREVQVNVEVNSEVDNDIVEIIARQKINPLVERLRYLGAKDLEMQIREIKQKNPQKKETTQYIQLPFIANHTKSISMPKEDDLRQQDSYTTELLMLYNRATRVKNLPEKIKYFYMVIEKEEGSKRKRDDLMNLRDALSHPKLSNLHVLNFLKYNIGSESIDYNNPNHIRFLKQMLPRFITEAKRIVDNMVH